MSSGSSSSAPGGGHINALGKVSLKIKSRYFAGLSGMVWKQGHFNRNWNLRYFILDFDAETLKYYDVPAGGGAKAFKVDKDKMFKGGYKIDKSTIISKVVPKPGTLCGYDFLFKIVSRQVDAQDIIQSKAEELIMAIGISPESFTVDLWAEFESVAASHGYIGDKFRDWLKDPDHFLDPKASLQKAIGGIPQQIVDSVRANVGARHSEVVLQTLKKQRSMFLEREVWLEALNDCKNGGYREIDTPSLWPCKFRPNVALSLSINNVLMTDVTFISPKLCLLPPMVTWRKRSISDSGTCYSICLIDADNVTGNPPARCHYLHWLVVNVKQQNINMGDTILSYVPPMPVYNSGPHRYFLLGFEQSRALFDGDIAELKKVVEKRTMSASTLASYLATDKQVSAGGSEAPFPPVAVAGFFAQWEDCVDAFHENYKYTPLPDFMSPKQKAENGSAILEAAKRQLCSRCQLGDIIDINEIDGHPLNCSLESCVKLKVSFKPDTDGSDLKDGYQVPNEVLMTSPNLSFKQSNNTFYTLMALNLDITSTKSELDSFIAWMVVNITGSGVSNGTAIIPYSWPSTFVRKSSNNSPLDRFVFLLYRQNTILSESDVEYSKLLFSTRNICKESLKAWLTGKLGLVDNNNPLAVRVFCVDTSVLVVSAPRTSPADVPISNSLDDMRYLSTYKLFAGNDSVYGAVMQKRLNTDFRFKERFIGISIHHKKIYWYKDLSRLPYDQNKDNTKSLSIALVSSVAVIEQGPNESRFVLSLSDPNQPKLERLELRLTSSNARQDGSVFKAIVEKLKGG